MTKTTITICLTFSLLIVSIIEGFSNDELSEALNSYNSGDYITTLKILENQTQNVATDDLNQYGSFSEEKEGMSSTTLSIRNANIILGVMYKYGKGIKKDKKKAYKFLQLGGIKHQVITRMETTYISPEELIYKKVTVQDNLAQIKNFDENHVFDLSSSNIKQENTISRITTDVPIIKQKTFIDKDKLSVELKKEQLTVKESETLLNEQKLLLQLKLKEKELNELKLRRQKIKKIHELKRQLRLREKQIAELEGKPLIIEKNFEAKQQIQLKEKQLVELNLKSPKLKNNSLKPNKVSPSTVYDSDLKSITDKLTEKLPKGSSIALLPINQKKAKLPANVAYSLSSRITNSLANSGVINSIKVIDRENLKNLMREQEEFLGVDDFSKLVEKAGADVLVSVQISRINKDSILISLRGTGIKGDIAGKVLGATSEISYDVPERYSALISGVFNNKGKRKTAYEDSLSSGITKFEEISLTQSKSIYAVDFYVKANYTFKFSQQKTKESRENEQGAKIMGSFSKMMGGFGGKASPMAAIMGSVAAGGASSKHLEKTVLNIGVSSELVDKINGRVFKDTRDAVINLPGDSDFDAKSIALKANIRELVKESGFFLAARALGKKTERSEKTLD